MAKTIIKAKIIVEKTCHALTSPFSPSHTHTHAAVAAQLSGLAERQPCGSVKRSAVLSGLTFHPLPF